MRSPAKALFFRRWLSVILAAVLLLGMAQVMPVAADAKSDLEQKLDNLEKKEKEIKNSLAAASSDLSASQQRKNLLDSQIDNVIQQITLLDNQLASLSSQITAKQTAITQAEADITAKEAAIQQTHDTLGERLRAIAKSGNMSALQRILNTENYTEYLLKTKAAECIAAYDQAAIDELESALADIQAQKKTLQSEKSGLEGKKNEVAALKTASDSKKKQLDTLYAAAQTEVNKLSSSISSYNQQLKATQEEIKKTDAAITALINSMGTSGKYDADWMYWPVPTVRAVSSHYGPRWGGLHRGLDVANGSIPIYGQNVVAAADGTVIYANSTSWWGGGYGYYVVVDHGLNKNGQIVSTLYGHCSAVTVSVGQKVTGGKTILGRAGASGNVSGPHLHFEVRLDGIQVNPWNYVRPNIN